MDMVNPFYTWTGYYPGDKPLRGGGGRYSGGYGIQYKPLFDVFGRLDADFDFMSYGLVNAPKTPLNWFMDQLVNDIKSSLKAPGGFSVIGDNPAFSSDQLTQEAREDWHEANQFLGTADMSIDLNPFNYAKDGKKHVWKQVRGVWNSFANYEDLDSNYKNQLIDGFAFGIQPQGFGAGAVATAFARSSFRRAPEGRPDDDATVLQLAGKNRGFAPVYKVEKETKKYLYTPEQVIADPKLRAQMNKEGLTPQEFIAKYKGSVSYENKTDVFEKYASALSNYYASADNNVGRRISFATLRDRGIEAIGVSYGDVTKDRTAFESFARTTLGLTNANDIDTAFVTLKGFSQKAEVFTSISKVEKSFADIGKQLGFAWNEGLSTEYSGRVTGLMSGLKSNVEKSKTKITELIDFYEKNGAPELADKFREQIKNYDKFLDDIERDFVTPFTSGAVNLNNRLHAQQLNAKLSSYRSQLSGSDVFNEGIKRNLSDSIMHYDMYQNGANNQAGYYNQHFEGVRRLMIWDHRISQEYEREAYGDLVRHFFGGKFANTYLYSSRIKSRISAWTPSAWITVFMKKMHFFGLSIDEKYLERDANKKFFIFRPMSWAITSTPLRKIFKNNVTVDVRDKKSGKLLFGKIQTEGGDHFKMALQLAKWKAEGKIDESHILAILGTDFKNPKDKQNFLNLLNKTGLLGDDDADIEKFLADLQKLQDWLRIQGAKLGIYNADGSINLDRLPHLMAFLNWVQNREAAGFDYISLTRKYAGLLEKLTSKLNRAQSFVATKLGKWAKPLTYIKVAIAEAVADIVAGWVEGGSGGLATPVVAAVRKIVKGLVVFVEDKIIGAAKAVWKAVVHFDFSDFGEAAVAVLESTMKKFAYASLGCGIFMLLPLLILMGILSTFNPENPAKSPPEDISFSGHGTVGGGGGGTLPGGTYGTGTNCPAGVTLHHPTITSGGYNNCYHWDGYRPLDIFATDGSNGYAPFDGTSYLYDDPGAGGYSVMMFPDEECLPAIYYAHNYEAGRVEGPITKGQVVSIVSNTGSACKPDANGNCTGAPHIHMAASTSAFFYSDGLDICSVQLLLDLVPGASCDTSSPGYGGTPCCNKDHPNKPGCSPALNQ